MDPFHPKDKHLSHSTSVQSQLVITASNDWPCSVTSEESSLLDVGIDNTWGNIDVNEIPMEILSDLDDTNSDIAISKPETNIQKFQLLTDVNRRKITMNFNFYISSLDKLNTLALGMNVKVPLSLPPRPLGMVCVCLTASLFC